MNKIYQSINENHYYKLCSVNLSNDALIPLYLFTILNSFISKGLLTHPFPQFHNLVSRNTRNSDLNFHQNLMFWLSFCFSCSLFIFIIQYYLNTREDLLFHFFFKEVSCQSLNYPFVSWEKHFNFIKYSIFLYTDFLLTT